MRSSSGRYHASAGCAGVHLVVAARPHRWTQVFKTGEIGLQTTEVAIRAGVFNRMVALACLLSVRIA
ncbi:protein of unknown function (plasmid) [Cupriavidus taiwanensis]|uniref:Uncharacterized protein n=1 Tax=Cupriavidus taiwanensis TaxID=164546 RepID=A0A375EE53_9BURK|nr:protein of unknown function [Cupriavidus taiwanensis]SOZ74363.1 protein of unknown function [Cupriavidus taiwanensis]SPA03269.1 protein of unknown function [Cupriavidus taiwanensis]SPA11248.1 protein of unknown function [Cupriavidus taiwanensis]SPA57210.1 protein of unknown function [Cupriavidus taiwanensis]